MRLNNALRSIAPVSGGGSEYPSFEPLVISIITFCSPTNWSICLVTDSACPASSVYTRALRRLAVLIRHKDPWATEA